jgi:hypothetical protein
MERFANSNIISPEKPYSCRAGFQLAAGKTKRDFKKARV